MILLMFLSQPDCCLLLQILHIKAKIFTNNGVTGLVSLSTKQKMTINTMHDSIHSSSHPESQADQLTKAEMIITAETSREIFFPVLFSIV